MEKDITIKELVSFLNEKKESIINQIDNLPSGGIDAVVSEEDLELIGKLIHKQRYITNSISIINRWENEYKKESE